MSKKAFISPEPHQIKEWVLRTFPHHRARRNATHGEVFLIDSPFIPSDSGLHVGILTGSGFVRDFRPQYKSLHDMSFLRFVSRVEGISYGEAVKLICGNSLQSLMAKAKEKMRKDYVEEEETVEPPTLEIPHGLLRFDDKEAEKNYPMAWEIATKYINKRGIPTEEASILDIRYNATGIYFLYKEYGQIVYWQKRSLLGKEYEFPPIFNEYLWGFDNIEPRSDIYITESMFNSASIGPNAGATGGSKLYPRQLRLLKMISPSSITMCTDNDKAGITFLRQSFYQLNPYYKLYYYLPPKDKDINDLAQKMNRLNNPDIVKNLIDNERKLLTKSSMIQATLNR